MRLSAKDKEFLERLRDLLDSDVVWIERTTTGQPSRSRFIGIPSSFLLASTDPRLPFGLPAAFIECLGAPGAEVRVELHNRGFTRAAESPALAPGHGDPMALLLPARVIDVRAFAFLLPPAHLHTFLSKEEGGPRFREPAFLPCFCFSSGRHPFPLQAVGVQADGSCGRSAPVPESWPVSRDPWPTSAVPRSARS